jgi:hypothetical protein
MVVWDRVTRRDVVHALEEYDRMGADRFFAEHGFGPAKQYLLVYNDRLYPSKAILGVAYEFATGRRLGSDDFEGGKSGAAAVLRRLRFEINNT